MSIFNILKNPPPPKPIYKRQPIATAAIILTIVGMFVLAPVGALWNGMAEELKKKADNTTVILLIQQQKQENDRQWEEIKENRKVRVVPQAMIGKIMAQPRGIALTEEEFEKYISMSPEIRLKYKKYLIHLGKDCSGLPE